MAQQHTPPAILLLLFFATIAAANTCGGNCPDNSCKSCVCPTTPDIINVTEWCGKYDWDQSCCQCMVTYLSKGNARQQQDQQMNRTGAWLFWNVYGKLSECDIEIPRPAPTPEGEHCKAKVSFDCAYKLYQSDGCWSFRSAACEYCGCDCFGDRTLTVE